MHPGKNIELHASKEAEKYHGSISTTYILPTSLDSS